MRLNRILFPVALAVVCATSFGQKTVVPLWPHGTPEPPQITAPEADVSKPADAPSNGRLNRHFTNVTNPTLTLYSPAHHNTGAAALVFPGGSYNVLAWDGEGVDACEWLNAAGITCLLVKYRVPEAGRYPENPADLEDAQQAMRIARAHAKEWHIDPKRIGVLGFSAGANLAVLLSTHPDDRHIVSTPAAADADAAIDARPDFAMLIYPAFLTVLPAEATLNAVYKPTATTPPTFLVQAENDRYFSKNALVYYRALIDAGVPAELHYYAKGGHGFGVHPVGAQPENWTKLAEIWMDSIHMLKGE
jgi:acetyl esterase/lipase